MLKGCLHAEKLIKQAEFHRKLEDLQTFLTTNVSQGIICFSCHKTCVSGCTTESHHIGIEVNTLAPFCFSCNKYAHNYELDNACTHLHLTLIHNGIRDLESWNSPVGAGFRGIVNLGSTCFMNSILQVIVHTKQIRDYFLLGTHRQNCAIAQIATNCYSRANDYNVSFPDTSNIVRYATCWVRPWYNPFRKGKPPVKKTKLNAQKRIELLEKTVPVCFGCELELVLAQMYSSSVPSRHPIIPNNLLHNMWTYSTMLAGYLEQDAHEFFNFIVNSVHSHTYTMKESTTIDLPIQGGTHSAGVFETFDKRSHCTGCRCPMHKTFGGIQVSKVVCKSCNVESKSLENFFDLSLDVFPNTSNHMVNVSLNCVEQNQLNSSVEKESKSNMVKPISLIDLLHHYNAIENLHGSEKLHCSSCGSREEGSKQMAIECLPSKLVFQLKRFKSIKGVYAKDDHPVQFPLQGLDMKPYTEETCKHGKTVECKCFRYDLYGIVHHAGTLDSGHYNAYIKQYHSWFLCDDAQVLQVNEEEVAKCQGYLLFYTKVES